ncbi:Hypothetical_protein [Hexamita inflata]|uniref:Hypothetical_protein n=1 Tax=Hexamita inflata TaxID=28002 RepID=A0AA86PCV2_9EUKA|nr:Hypothetical protein HINF_LOCUS22763 [Hexamita inflata]
MEEQMETGFIKLVNAFYGTNYTDLKDAFGHYKLNPIAPNQFTNSNSMQLRNDSEAQQSPRTKSFYIPQTKRKEAYSWTIAMHVRFVFVCMLLGIKKSTPKKVQELLEDFQEVTTGVIGRR